MLETKAKPRRINLTKDAIIRLKAPAEGRVYVYDEKVAGLAICTTAAGTKTFYHYRKVEGKPERTKLGPWPEWTVDQARRRAASLNGGIAEGKNPAAKIRTARNAPTLGEVFDQFIELPTRTKAKRPKAANTLIGYRQQFKACLESWRDCKLSTIKKSDIEKLHNEIGVERGQYMANRVLGLLKSLFNCAIDLGLYDANPAARLLGFEEKSRERFLYADEFPQFWKSLEAETSEKVRDFLKVALLTGQRKMNCLQMKWEQINLERAIWTIPQTKTGRHEVPLPIEAVKILKRRHGDRGDREYVFPGRHGHGHLKDPYRQWREILKRAGIEDMRIHDLRRSLGSWQAATGASLPIVGKTLGHKRPETTAIYARLDLSPVRAAMETATAAMMAAAEPAKRTSKRKAVARGKAK